MRLRVRCFALQANPVPLWAALCLLLPVLFDACLHGNQASHSVTMTAVSCCAQRKLASPIL